MFSKFEDLNDTPLLDLSYILLKYSPCLKNIRFLIVPPLLGWGNGLHHRTDGLLYGYIWALCGLFKRAEWVGSGWPFDVPI